MGSSPLHPLITQTTIQNTNFYYQSTNKESKRIELNLTNWSPNPSTTKPVRCIATQTQRFAQCPPQTCDILRVWVYYESTNSESKRIELEINCYVLQQMKLGSKNIEPINPKPRKIHSVTNSEGTPNAHHKHVTSSEYECISTQRQDTQTSRWRVIP